MNVKLLGIVISMLCVTSFVAANGTVDAKKDKSVLATENAVEAVDAEEVDAELAQAEEALQAKKVEETKAAQDKKSCSPCCK